MPNTCLYLHPLFRTVETPQTSDGRNWNLNIFEKNCKTQYVLTWLSAAWHLSACTLSGCPRTSYCGLAVRPTTCTFVTNAAKKKNELLTKKNSKYYHTSRVESNYTRASGRRGCRGSGTKTAPIRGGRIST